MSSEPRIRVSAILRWRDGILLCRHEKGGLDHWLLPGGGVRGGETLIEALERELDEETGLVAPRTGLPLEGPVAIAESIAPARSVNAKHIVHVIFAAEVSGSLESVFSTDEAVRGHRLFTPEELSGVSVHPPIQRFLQRWQPGDPCVYLGSMWVD